MVLPLIGVNNFSVSSKCVSMAGTLLAYGLIIACPGCHIPLLNSSPAVPSRKERPRMATVTKPVTPLS